MHPRYHTRASSIKVIMESLYDIPEVHKIVIKFAEANLQRLQELEVRFILYFTNYFVSPYVSCFFVSLAIRRYAQCS
jgi:hypothetical protein